MFRLSLTVKMRYTHFLTTCLLAALCAPAYSQVNPDLVGSCEIGQAEAYLDIGNVRARLFNSGNLFWRGSPHVYRIPIDGKSNAIFVDDFWFGGMVDGDLRVAGGVYGPWEFWPGPIPEDGFPPSDCSPFDKFWTIEADEDLLSSRHTDYPSPSVVDWPVELGARYLELDDMVVLGASEDMPPIPDANISLYRGSEAIGPTASSLAKFLISNLAESARA